MKSLAFIAVLFVSLVCGKSIFAQDPVKSLTKNSFYSAMQGDNEDAVNKQLEQLKTSALAEKKAYEGALLMKKAGIVSGPGKKLNLFKDGHKKLEDALNKDSTNVEFRFLRLMIQEHAPGILGYKSELQKDKLYIKTHFKKLSPPVQEAVVNYSKKSKVLKPEDL